MQPYLLEPLTDEQIEELTPEEMKIIIRGEKNLNQQYRKYIKELEQDLFKTQQKSFLLEDQTIQIKHRLFGKSSEKSDVKSSAPQAKKTARKKILLPSERYPNIPVVEKLVTLENPPHCQTCQQTMKDSGLTEESEYLTVIPRKFYVVKQVRTKYRCPCCQDNLVTAPSIPRIKPGSSFSDEMVLDVALSKYCDLIPIERYVQMAARAGVTGLPANSLIQGTHNLAEFLRSVYEKIKLEVMSSLILHADETPHRMLEGDDKSNWYLWGFSSAIASIFEARDTRSGSVATDIMKDSKCEYLVSDVFSGYSKAVSDSNKYRIENNRPLIKNLYCNAHARRKFKEAELSFPKESRFFIWCYRKIYRLESLKDYPDRRKLQEFYYKVMEKMGLKLRLNYSLKSSLVKAIDYFIKNFNELTYFLKHEDLPIDNNSQERLMRNPVIGRKTWYGTHSKQGAETNAILFSLVESCKLNKINPRDYFKDIVHAIHEKRVIFTPNEYLKSQPAKNS
jgi:transposase